jgi:hypothetical protein
LTFSSQKSKPGPTHYRRLLGYTTDGQAIAAIEERRILGRYKREARHPDGPDPFYSGQEFATVPRIRSRVANSPLPAA